jgi:hypothetical protein
VLHKRRFPSQKKNTPGYARYKLHDVEKEEKHNAFLPPQQDTAKTPVLEHLFNCMSCFGIHAIYTCVSPSSNSTYNVI